MKTLTDIKGIIFDYGGTIDTNSRHWAEVLWEKYTEASVPVSKDSFREAYVHGERELAKHPHVRPEHNFYDVLAIKTQIQMDHLAEKGFLPANKNTLQTYAKDVSDRCYKYVQDVLAVTLPVVQTLSKRYRLVLVSNFYGNIHTILQDFGLSDYFCHVIESAVVGVRKPDPAIYQMGVEAMGYDAANVVVIGDSFAKDMVPAKSIGCQTIWLKGEGWGNEVTDDNLPNAIITSLEQLPSLLALQKTEEL